MSRQMKDSDADWIGEIPYHWETTKLKYIFSIKKDISNELGYDILSVTQGGIKIKDISKNEGQISADYSKYQLVDIDDFIMNHMDLLTGWVDCSKYQGVTSPDYRVFKLIDEENHCKEFYTYLFQACYMNKIFYGLGQGISNLGRWRLQTDKFYNFMLPVLSLTEQQAIAHYLDRRCTEIDGIIQNTRTSIEEYRAYKRSVITEVVTKGLNPNAPMKESGVEWIGKIPNYWEIEPFRRILHERIEKNLPVKTDERLSLSIDKGVTLYSEKTTNLDRFKEDVSQYKLAYKGDLVLNSMNMIVGAVGVSDYFGCVSPAYYTYFDTTEGHYTSRYCDYAFRCKTMRKLLFCLGRGIMAIERGDDRVNTCRLKVSRADLRNIKFPIPSLEEQKEIVNYLDSKCSEIDELIAKKEKLLIEIVAYKKSLIYECVTGKKEV